MSSDFVIRFEGVGKEYRVGAAQGRSSYNSLGERLAGTLRNPFSAAAGALRRPASDTFWALKDVSFDVKPGEVVGVIGRNGAGKSTLLKILSQITKPTEGQIAVNGRVGSLLEVGTGFHPELSGRENIFLNGAILGMTRREVKSKFDEIVAFSEVEKFLDTPVKQYSSGMYTRLAFAVAAHLDPEVLVVDEVLAVGDAEFQKKCLGKMQDVASGGRTVLFVSHNMGTVRSLCHRAILLSNGTFVLEDRAGPAVDAYLETLRSHRNTELKDRTDRKGKGESRFVSIHSYSPGSSGEVAASTGKPLHIEFTTSMPVTSPRCVFTIYDPQGAPVTNFHSDEKGPNDIGYWRGGPDDPLKCIIDPCLLRPATYRLNAAMYSGDELQDHVESAHRLTVSPGDVYGRTVSSNNSSYGSVSMPHRWSASLPADGGNDSVRGGG